MKLHIFEQIPESLLETKPVDLHSVLSGPSLINLQGKTEPPLFISTLLHGNETTGFLAIQKILKKYLTDPNRPLPRSLMIFVGNIEAAKQELRRLPGQLDFNRIWNGGNSPEHALANQVVEVARKRGIFALIDIHNTSGKNPHFACANKLDPAFINLGKLFSRTLVYFTRPEEVLSLAFSKFCTSVSLESGQPGELYGVNHVYDYIEWCLNLSSIPETTSTREEVDIFHSIARIQVPPNSRIRFNGKCDGADFCFNENFDALNFMEMPANDLLGWRFNPELKLSVMDENGREVMDDFIHYHENEIRLKRSVVPSMFTTNEKIIFQDCLGYLMERYSPS